MKNIFQLLTAACLCILFISCDKNTKSSPSKVDYLGKKIPESIPELYAPGIISTGHHEHSGPSFTPDGKEVYWSVFLNFLSPQVILYMKNTENGWTPPEVASFSGQFSDGGPFISPDGKRLFFYSIRPFNGKVKEDADLWYVERKGNTWSEPYNVGAKLNTENIEASPSVSSNGNLYFYSDRNGGFGGFDIYCSKYLNGEYNKPENLGTSINSIGYECYPYIAPDENYILFSGSERGEGFGQGDIYISFKKEDGDWEKALNLGKNINDEYDNRFPIISNNGEILFFVSNKKTMDFPFKKRLLYRDILEKLENPGNGRGDIYWVSTQTLDVLKH